MRMKWISEVFLLVFVLVQPVWGKALELEPEPGITERENGQPTSLYGYGEMHFNSPKGGTNQMDFHRLVIGISHQFNSWISFHSEVDLEHGFAEPYVEYAHLDLELNSDFNVRAGSVLVPMGFTNEYHEPPVFFSVERPLVENRIIPTTWPEGGAGIFGSPLPGLRYRVYLVSGLDALGDEDRAAQFCRDGFTAGSGLRGGRCKAAESSSEDFAVVGRIEYTSFPGLQLGISGYRGGADQGKIPGADVTVTMWDVDAHLRYAGFDLQGLYVRATIDDVAALNAAKGFTGSQSVGEQLFGWYVTLGYHLGGLMASGQDLVPFVRYEQLDTQDKVPAGFSRDLSNDQKVITTGIAYYPHERVALKGDYQIFDREDGTTLRQFNLGVGWMF